MHDKIFNAAIKIATIKGYKRITRSSIAKRAGVAPGSVSYHFKSMKALRDAVVANAIETGTLAIIAQALSDRHPLALQAPEALRKAAAMQLAG